MVLRPVYHSQADEPNMQYPYQSTEPIDQGTWQTPYGTESQSTAYGVYASSQTSPPPVDQMQVATGPYAATIGESSNYYDHSQQQLDYKSGWESQNQSVYGQSQHDNGPSYDAQYQPSQAHYGSDYPPANPYGPQNSYNPNVQYATPEVKHEEQPYENGQQFLPYQEGAFTGPFAPKAEGATQPSPVQAFQRSPDQAFEQDRGVMGAIAGAAAGGYAGHKLHHGFLGALGGAYAGHKLEDAYKDHKKHSNPPSSAPPPYSQPAPVQNQPMRQGNFSASSHDITLDKDYDLIASCKDVKGRRKLSAISLNNVLTNDDGFFKWVTPGSGVGNFAASARQVKLVDGGKALEAELRRRNGQWRKDVVRLDERIENSDGDLKMT